MTTIGVEQGTAVQNSSPSRRHFMASAAGSIGAAWLAASWPAIVAAHTHAATTTPDANTL
jgi:hypothetical protein